MKFEQLVEQEELEK